MLCLTDPSGNESCVGGGGAKGRTQPFHRGLNIGLVGYWMFFLLLLSTCPECMHLETTREKKIT